MNPKTQSWRPLFSTNLISLGSYYELIYFLQIFNKANPIDIANIFCKGDQGLKATYCTNLCAVLINICDYFVLQVIFA